MQVPLSAPTLTPTTAAGGSMPASKSPCSTPTWAAPLAPPPPSTHVRRADPNNEPPPPPPPPRPRGRGGDPNNSPPPPAGEGVGVGGVIRESVTSLLPRKRGI